MKFIQKFTQGLEFNTGNPTISKHFKRAKHEETGCCHKTKTHMRNKHWTVATLRNKLETRRKMHRV